VNMVQRLGAAPVAGPKSAKSRLCRGEKSVWWHLSKASGLVGCLPGFDSIFTCPMRFVTQIGLLATLLLPAGLLAQTRPVLADTARTEPDQELDDFSGGFAGTHVMTASLRGTRGAKRTYYVVAADGRQLWAYQAGKLLWATDVAAPFLAQIPAARIASLVLSSNLLSVNLGPRGMAEVDRKTGKIGAKYFDRDPANLVADPR
jgi:hypothetical protein